MRNEQEMMNLILGVARDDELIRAVLLVGSRANPAIPKDAYQDYDVTFFVADIAPFYNNPAWVEARFGKPLIMQMPETMRYPTRDGSFIYMMIYPDGNRIDLSFKFERYIDDGEPAVVLLDKDNGSGFLPSLPAPSDKRWHIKTPSPLFFYSCCNNFWWCLNNAAKGIMRDELSYVMYMLNDVVRSELHDMINYYIGTQYGFNLSTGKKGKYFKKYLSPEVYAQYAATYSGSDYADIWAAVDVMCDLFHTLALTVAAHFDYTYRQEEEDGMREYIRMVREGFVIKDSCEKGYIQPASKPLSEVTDQERSRLFPIILCEYNPVWVQWYTEEKENLQRLIGEENIIRINHYGSTSVSGLLAKPTVDILLEIKDGTDFDKLIAALPYPEYIPQKRDFAEEKLMFYKGYTPTGFADKVYHIHIRYPGDNPSVGEWDELVFRDYLISHPETALEYATLKLRLKEEFEYDRDGYTDAKSEFIKAVTKKAREVMFYAKPGEPLRVAIALLGELNPLRFVVIFACMNGKWIYARHKERDTWETAGGHIEPGETPYEAAKRELYEETGATDFDLASVFDYSVNTATEFSYGRVFFADVHKLGELPESEMAEVRLFDSIPDSMTYPQILPLLYHKMQTHLVTQSSPVKAAIKL